MDRKIVYIDVGNMPLNKASKKVYDTLDKIRGYANWYFLEKKIHQ